MGFKIREKRRAQDMTQDELAEKSGVSRTIIAGLESGAIEVTTTRTLEKIALALNSKVEDIFFSD